MIAGAQARIVPDYTVPADMEPGKSAAPAPVRSEPLPNTPSFTPIL